MMKMIRTLLLSALLLSCFQAWPSYVWAGVCQNKTAIVYSNGMFNDRKDSEISLIKLRRMLVSFPQASQYLTEFEFHLAYASDGSQYQLGGTNPIIGLINKAIGLANAAGQITEVILQKILQDDYSAFWRWLAGIQAASPRLQNLLNQAAAGANSISYLFDPDLQKQVALYAGLLNSGNRVVIVAHSQGNFYANAAYSRLTTLNNPAWASSVGIVQVATPAASNQGSKLGNDEPQITVPEDLVMKYVHKLNPGLVMKTKPVKGSSRNMIELRATYAAANYGHSFVQWYLAGTDTRKFILTGIINTRNALQPAAYDMIPQRVTAGTRVAPGPKGGIYVTKVGGGVILIDANGVAKPVPGVSRVDFVDAANNLYYSDVAIDPLNWRTAATVIYKRNANGIVSTVYNSGFQGIASYNFNAISSYDVAADGTLYVLDDTSYMQANQTLAHYHSAYKVKNGVTSKIAGAPPLMQKFRRFLFISNRARIGGVAIDSNFSSPLDNLISIRDMANGGVLMTITRVGAWGGPFSYAVNASGMIVPIPFPPMSHGNFDVCANGTVVGDIVGGAAKINSMPRLGVNVSSVALSQDGNDLYYVDSLTSSVMKFVGRSK